MGAEEGMLGSFTLQNLSSHLAMLPDICAFESYNLDIIVHHGNSAASNSLE